MPSRTRVRGAQDPLCEQQIYDEQDDDSGSDEDTCGDGNGGIGWARCPNDAHDTGRCSRHTETEHGTGHLEVVAATAIQLEDGHMGDGAAQKQEEKDCGDGYVKTHGGLATQSGGSRGIGRARWSSILRRRLQKASALLITIRRKEVILGVLSGLDPL